MPAAQIRYSVLGPVRARGTWKQALGLYRAHHRGADAERIAGRLAVPDQQLRMPPAPGQ